MAINRLHHGSTPVITRSLRHTTSHLVQCECLGDGEAPPSLKGPADHGGAGGGRGRGQAKGVVELEACYLDGEVNKVDGGEEGGEAGLRGDIQPMEGLGRGGEGRGGEGRGVGYTCSIG